MPGKSESGGPSLLGAQLAMEMPQGGLASGLSVTKPGGWRALGAVWSSVLPHVTSWDVQSGGLVSALGLGVHACSAYQPQTRGLDV